MALTREFHEAVSQGNLLRVKIMLKDSLLLDTSFKQFDEMIEYAEGRLSDIWVSDDKDNEVFSQSKEELNAILVGLVNNFSKRRVEHLKRMISTFYPPQLKTNQQTVTKIKITREIKNELNGICNDKKKITMFELHKLKSQVDKKCVEEIRSAAMSIVNHCDKILRR